MHYNGEIYLCWDIEKSEWVVDEFTTKAKQAEVYAKEYEYGCKLQSLCDAGFDTTQAEALLRIFGEY